MHEKQHSPISLQFTFMVLPAIQNIVNLKIFKYEDFLSNSHISQDEILLLI